MESGETKFVVVSKQAAKENPYPYVFVLDDGTVRELLDSEKSFLETPFLPMDGGRPAIKESYSSKNGWGSVRGFCLRNKLPDNTLILKSEASYSAHQEFQDDSESQTEIK